MSEIFITAEQFNIFLAHFQSVEGYLGNMFVLLLWSTLAIFFIMAVALYIAFTGRGKG